MISTWFLGWSGLTSFRESLSDADITITKKIVEAGKLFDIAMLDHIIIGETRIIHLLMRVLYRI